jgi:hypothetical protein
VVLAGHGKMMVVMGKIPAFLMECFHALLMVALVDYGEVVFIKVRHLLVTEVVRAV